MNNGLINLMTSESLQGQAVNAQDLYNFLEIKTPFKDWIKRMFDYGFENNKDYIILLKNEQKPVSKSNPLNYAITLGMAKEISMIQRSEKGKQARLYFIACEERLKEVVKPKTRVEMARDLLALEEEIEQKELALIEMKPKADIYDDFMKADTLQTVTQIGQVLGITATKLNRFLEEHNFYSKQVSRSRVFKMWVIDAKLGRMVESQRGFTQSLFTATGVMTVIELYNKHNK